MVNNYVKIRGLSDEFLCFNDRDSSDVMKVQKKVMESTGGRFLNVSLWKRCQGLPYSLIGEPSGRPFLPTPGF